MRHRVKGRKLGRSASHRTATLRSLATALFTHKKIKTTLAKAKEARRFAEKLITKAKVDSVANRRYVARHINDKEVVQELFNEIIPSVGERPGGYTRVVKLGTRLGDAAEMAILEMVDYNNVPGSKKAAKPAESKVEEANVVEETVEETPAEEEKAEETTEEVKAEDTAEEASEDKKEEK